MQEIQDTLARGHGGVSDLLRNGAAVGAHLVLRQLDPLLTITEIIATGAGYSFDTSIHGGSRSALSYLTPIWPGPKRVGPGGPFGHLYLHVATVE